MKISRNKVEDLDASQYFITAEPLEHQASIHKQFPNDTSSEQHFRHVSLELALSPHRTLVKRELYNGLDLLAAVGGLLAMLFAAGRFILIPFTRFVISCELTTNLFRWRPSEPLSEAEQEKRRAWATRRRINGDTKMYLEEDEHQVLHQMQWDCEKSQAVRPKSFCETIFCRDSAQKSFRRSLEKAQTTLDRELDLSKFVHRQRVTSNALQALLTCSQMAFVDKMSRLLIHESSHNEDTSEDGELDKESAQVSEKAREVVLSKDCVDERLVDVYRVRKVNEEFGKRKVKDSDPGSRHTGSSSIFAQGQNKMPQSGVKINFSGGEPSDR